MMSPFSGGSLAACWPTTDEVARRVAEHADREVGGAEVEVLHPYGAPVLCVEQGDHVVGVLVGAGHAADRDLVAGHEAEAHAPGFVADREAFLPYDHAVGLVAEHEADFLALRLGAADREESAVGRGDDVLGYRVLRILVGLGPDFLAFGADLGDVPAGASGFARLGRHVADEVVDAVGRESGGVLVAAEVDFELPDGRLGAAAEDQDGRQRRRRDEHQFPHCRAPWTGGLRPISCHGLILPRPRPKSTGSQA